MAPGESKEAHAWPDRVGARVAAARSRGRRTLRRSPARSPASSRTRAAACCPASTVTMTQIADRSAGNRGQRRRRAVTRPRRCRSATTGSRPACPGFKGAVRSGVDADDRRRRARRLHARSRHVQEVVEVSAQASLVDANTSSVGKLVDNRRIAELPLNTRNVYSLIFLTPGVSGTIGNAYGDLRYTINGARPRSSDTLVDGVTATFPTVTGGVGHLGVPVGRRDPGVQGARRDVPGRVRPQPRQRHQRRLQVGLERVPRQRVRVPARLGVRFARTTSRSGAARSSGDFSRHQFGGAAGGPMQTGKMFYMVSFEGLREKAFSSPHADGADRARTAGGLLADASPRTARSSASSTRSRRGRTRRAASSAISSPTTGSRAS